jgi:CheY-like chemotaxis protein
VLNLCLNARDAMAEGGRLTIEAANTELDDGYAAANADVEAGAYVMVAVSDTGIGMVQAVAACAFDPFFTTKEPGKGSGLGLSQVFGFVKQSNGHVKIYSEPGHGTTVKIYLPRAGEPYEAARPVAVPEVSRRGSERILLVEDDDLVRRHVAAQLAGLGYDVTSAHDGQDALAILGRAPRFDLLFTDVMMPGGMSGRQLADQVKVRHPDLPVLFTSGYTDESIVHNGRLDPGVQLLQKPYRRQDLATRLRALLDGRDGSDARAGCGRSVLL